MDYRNRDIRLGQKTRGSVATSRAAIQSGIFRCIDKVKRIYAAFPPPNVLTESRTSALRNNRYREKTRQKRKVNTWQELCLKEGAEEEQIAALRPAKGESARAIPFAFGRATAEFDRDRSWRLLEQLGSEEREVRAVMVRRCRPRSMRRPVRILCAPRVTLTHQTNSVKVYYYSRQRQSDVLTS